MSVYPVTQVYKYIWTRVFYFYNGFMIHWTGIIAYNSSNLLSPRVKYIIILCTTRKEKCCQTLIKCIVILNRIYSIPKAYRKSSQIYFDIDCYQYFKLTYTSVTLVSYCFEISFIYSKGISLALGCIA